MGERKTCLALLLGLEALLLKRFLRGPEGLLLRERSRVWQVRRFQRR